MEARVQILVRGIVQGVGFRPFIFSLARKQSLKGQVFNNRTGVFIEVEGESKAIERFISEIESSPPPLSLIESVEHVADLYPANYADFRIVESECLGEKFIPVSADVATCEQCLGELFDPGDRRYRYPFINCTNCGPRFTIIDDVPYDRANTTMRDFGMCAGCRAEYEDPLDRRFHAEPTACPACGPRVFLMDSDGNEIAPGGRGEDDAISQVRRLLLDGMVIAIKGIGGFHLACDGLNREAVERLRQRKYREDKPFAMMVDSLDVIRRHCYVSNIEEELLLSAQRPVVLLERKPDSIIPRAVAPGVNTLGFMLPYSPLHHLLLENIDRPLVMTSGNISDEPICYEDRTGVERLGRIADYFLMHNRRIHIRTDDSVVRALGNREMVLRRSRGYAPLAIKTAFKFEQEVLACGAELKNTFCLARDNFAFVSHHIGDLKNLETLRSFTEGIEHFKRLFNLRPAAVAYDLHPEYLSTRYALSLDEIERKIGVQHHHAHIASCMADNRIDGEVIGVAMDGLGFGSDGRFWGGEFFVADFNDAERIAHLDYVPMPGGAHAIREPWRMAAVCLHRALGDAFLNLDLAFVHETDRRAWSALRAMIEAGTNSPETSSMGRLFDALSSLLGLRRAINYEGQAAIELEAIADRGSADGYEFELDRTGGVIRADAVIRRAVDDLLDGVSPSVVSAKFHAGVADLIARVARGIRDERRINRVALSGGVFQNMLLMEKTCGMLSGCGFEVFTHSRVPTNDGGISLGQAAVARARIASGRI
ncbi:MAG TPA: carbamoyltransferase HypF [Blastocatellia bacterium]|nr:carbamoyltransferase HypF [Blastocatellia bacterium]